MARRASCKDMHPLDHREHVRKLARLRKRAERERLGAEGVAARAAAETAAGRKWELLLPKIRKLQNGCWLWVGPYHATHWSGPRPLHFHGQYGRMLADVAVYLLHTGRRELPRGAYLKRTCGDHRCVAPEHGIATNRIVEAAKAELEKGKNDGKQGQRKPQQARQRLSRVG